MNNSMYFRVPPSIAKIIVGAVVPLTEDWSFMFFVIFGNRNSL